MIKQYCVLCGYFPQGKKDYEAWRIEHDQRDHTTYYAVQVGITE